jgi:hypothetical protein
MPIFSGTKLLPDRPDTVAQWCLATLDIPSTHLITKVKQCWTHSVLGWVNTKMTSMPGGVRRRYRILRPGKVSEKTPRRVLPPVCIKYRRKTREKNGTPGIVIFQFPPVNPRWHYPAVAANSPHHLGGGGGGGRG